MARRARKRVVVDPGLPQPPERLGERLARHAGLPLDVPAAPNAVLLLGDVGELEEERERAQDLRLLREVELANFPGELRADLGITGLARTPRDLPDLLLALEQVLALLLDHDAPEQVAEQADVPAERRVGRHGMRDYAP